jgi:hypothetical protein
MNPVMPIDPYTPCPGGTGKKIKFCCSDLVGELDKIQRMLEGEQKAGCLEHIESLESKYPQRACLMSIKAMLQAQLGQDAGAQATLSEFMAKYPENPVALAEHATLVASGEGGVAAIAPLQDALERCAEQIPPQVYDAIGLVSQALIADSQLLAARAHLVLQISISGTNDQRPLQLLMRINGSPSIPLVAKQDLPLLLAPDDALWKKGFTAAMEPAGRGAWRLAEKNLVELAARVGDWPAIWHNIAVLRTWLADSQGAVEAWHKFAAQQIPLDDAVEAEGLAQWLDTDAIDQVDVLTVTYAVNDVEALQARLTANERSLTMPIDLSRMASENEPPPKGAYWLLDKEASAKGAEVTLDQIPHVVGQVFLFGKQTDRPARLELITYRPEADQARETAAAIGGDALGAAGAEEVTTHVPAVNHLLSRNWRLPDDTPARRRFALMDQHRRAVLLDRWPELPQKIFDGKSAQQVAGDPAWRIKLLAAITLLQWSTDQQTSDFDWNALRAKLQCPPQDPVDPSNLALTELPLMRLARVDVSKLTDEQLLDLYRRADHYRHVAALRKFAHELLNRPNVDKEIDRAEIYGTLAHTEPDADQAIKYLEQARAAAEAGKTSTAPWDLAELSLRLASGEVADADRLLHHIREQHMREPGVAQALFQILADAGIIGPDGRPTMPAAAEAPGIVVPGAAGAAGESGKIWTPGSEQPATGKKSALWTPGME